jgi:hypothetical protein
MVDPHHITLPMKFVKRDFANDSPKQYLLNYSQKMKVGFRGILGAD